MNNGNKFLKFGLLLATTMFFASALGISIGSAQAKSSNSDFADMTVIGEDLPTSIDVGFERSFEVKKGNSTKVKKVSPVIISTSSSVCTFHVLEQQGSPSAPTVKVCVGLI